MRRRAIGGDGGMRTRAAITLTGGTAALNLSAAARAISTYSHVASVGHHGQRAPQESLKTDSRTLGLDNMVRVVVNCGTRAFVKMIAEAGTGRRLGVRAVSPHASELIQACALAVHHRVTAHNLESPLFPHLTMMDRVNLTAHAFSMDVRQLPCCAG